jgi:5'-nucleotidase
MGVLLCPGVDVDAQDGTLAILHTDGFRGRFEQMLKVGPILEAARMEVGRVVLLDGGNALAPSEGSFVHPEGGASLTVTLLNRAGYNGWVPGQQAFGLSQDRLTGYLRGARFPVLGANLHRADTGRPPLQVQPYSMVWTGGLRVGVLGLGPAGSGLAAGDPIGAAQYYVPILRESADIVVLLCHLGAQVDSALAVSVPGVDLIIDGRPDNGRAGIRRVNGVPISGGDRTGTTLGRIDLVLAGGRVSDVSGRRVPLDATPLSPETIERALVGWTAAVDGEAVPVWAPLGTCAGGFAPDRRPASAMDYLVADLMRAASGADVAFVAAANLNPELREGPIRVLDLFRVYPWSHRVVVLSIKGERIRDLLEGSLSTPGTSYHPSGLVVVTDPSRAKGERVVSVTFGGERLESGQVYRVAVEEAVAAASGTTKGLADALDVRVRRDTGILVRDLLARHIRSAGVIRGTMDGRVQSR